jgi:hypothetical protein
MGDTTVATNLEFDSAAAPRGPAWRADQQFFVNMNIALVVLVVFGFAQFALRGMVDFGRVGWWVHVHGAAMLAWLGLNITQARLANSGSIAQHRRLGMIGLGLALAIALLGAFTGTMAVIRGTLPPFFEPGYFLALTNIGMAMFFAVIVLAVRLRRDTEWHRRIMLVALIVILEPALGRILPIPLIQPYGQWAELAVQLGVLGVAMRHDLRHAGAVHPAYKVGAAIILGFHLVIFTVGNFAPWVALAESLRA